MDNTVLQKLLHAHVLLKKNPRKFQDNFVPPDHIAVDVSDDPNKYEPSLNWDNQRNRVPPKLLSDWLESHARRVQQSMKFYIPESSHENKLTGEEYLKLTDEMKMFLPFKSTFVQHEVDIGITESKEAHKAWNKIALDGIGTKVDLKKIEEKMIAGETCIANVYLEDVGYEDDEEQPMFKGNVSIYFRDDNTFFIDPNDYYFSYRGGMGYTFWLPEQSPFYQYTDTGSDVDGGMYNNPTLNSMVSTIINVHSQLVLMLSYPQIVNRQSILGVTPKNAGLIPFSKKYTNSEFLRKPKYEHKVLKLDLFGDTNSNGNGSTGESGSRAFHAVRKHIRQYSDGKITFVKAHFRGSKDVGLVTKDYEIVNRSK